jgi:hypothetical protein
MPQQAHHGQPAFSNAVPVPVQSPLPGTPGVPGSTGPFCTDECSTNTTSWNSILPPRHEATTVSRIYGYCRVSHALEAYSKLKPKHSRYSRITTTPSAWRCQSHQR